MKKNKPSIILLVEDDLDHAELVMRSFQSQQVIASIYHVSDGEAALDYLFRRGKYASPQQSPRPNIILLDLRLPKIDGLEVLNTVKNDEKLRHIPVVILTTSEAERDMANAYQKYANSYLVKPVDFGKFTELMDDMSFYWLNWNRPSRLLLVDNNYPPDYE
jgi:CheY-like chemotaxis protein